MKKESKLNLNAGDYAISHCDSDKTYNGLEVHKMLCDAYIAGNNDTLEDDNDERIKNSLINLIKMSNKVGGLALHKWEADEMLAWIEKQAEERKITHEEICKSYGIPDIGEFSDGYHTFNGLYKQRMILFAVLVKTYKDRAWKSWKHEDGLDCFGGGWFIVGIDTPAGTYTYHYEAKDWDRFDCQILEKAKHWDGHDESDVERLFSLVSNANKDEVIRCLINGMKFYYEDNEEATWGTEKFSMKVKDILDWLEKQGQVKESFISQHEIETCKENNNSLTSENDRIRREIINYFQCQSEEEPTRKEIHNKWIAWIERQGEKDAITFNNAHIIDPALNDYCCKQYDALHKENGGVLSFARLQHLAMDIYGWCKGQIEQKPAWSEEDEERYDSCIACIRACSTGDGVDIANIEWIKSVRDRVQPKQEWSEEDKYMYDILCGTIENTDINENTKYKLISWLKSLRPQNHWKPSDEQMGLLQAIINEPNNAASESCQIILKDILEQLRKLKEE